MTDAPPLLELDRATVVRNGTAIIDDLSLIIPSGQHTAILGPNGSGKSSLVKLVTQQLHPLAHADGRPPVRVLGRSDWNIFDLRPMLGIISADMHHRLVDPERGGLTSSLDAVVSGFFASEGLSVQRRPTELMWQRANAALATMEVAHLAERPLSSLSTGEARRVLIARALVTEPRALLLDEPTTGLDLVARRRFLDRLRKIAQSGTTVVLVTHHVDEILPEIGRIILLSHGRIAEDGSKATMLTPERLTAVFEAPVELREEDDYYSAML
ncbi:MAG: ATP-binding cassette domain-containing protein [Gemmatimonadota bacterium]